MNRSVTYISIFRMDGMDGMADAEEQEEGDASHILESEGED